MGSNKGGFPGQLVAWVLRRRKRLVCTLVALACTTLLLWVTPVPKQAPPHPSFLTGVPSSGSGQAYCTLDDGTVGWVFDKSYEVAKDYGEVLPLATQELSAQGWKHVDASGWMSENDGPREEYLHVVFWRKPSLFEVAAPSVTVHQNQSDRDNSSTTVRISEAVYSPNMLRALFLGVDRILHLRKDLPELASAWRATGTP